uniref:CCHC-type domain-containing protein n=1 Tax=Anopheles epiroticus TaxID=199890 RepID=A0A182PWX5_9DIPT
MRRIDSFVKSFTVDKVHEVATRLERLEKVWYNFEEVQEELEKLEEDNEANEEMRAEIEELYMCVRSDLLRLMSPSNPIDRDEKPVAVMSQVKLPVIQLPEFAGDFNDWLAFHDTFVSLIDKSIDLSCVQKLHYLKAALKGEAARLIDPILTTEENYNIAWQMLVDRYGNKDLLKKRHIQAILRLTKMSNSSMEALRRTVDEFQRHTLVLEQLGEPVKYLSSFLVELLSEKLDSASLAAWEEAQADKKHSYNDMIDFLHKRVRLLETLADGGAGESSKRLHRVKVSVNAATAARKMEKCVVCGKEGHTIVSCRRFCEFDSKKRQHIVRQQKLCWNCLQGGHFVSNCVSRYGCQACGQRHHTLLHCERDSVTADELAGSVSTMVLANIPQQRNSSDSGSYNKVLLTTMVLFVMDANGVHHPVRALLDNGAQPNAISERLSQLMCLPRVRTNVPITGVDGTTTKASCEMNVEIRSRFSEFALRLKFLVLSKLTSNTPGATFNTSRWRLPAELPLADPEFHVSGRIDMLIGASHFYTFLKEGRFKLCDQGPMLVETVFGWVVTGEVLQEEAKVQQVSAQCNVMISSHNISEQLERFWKIEELHVSHLSADEQKCEQYYEKTVSPLQNDWKIKDDIS